MGIFRFRPSEGAPVEAAAKKRTEIASFMALLLLVLLLLESEGDLLSDAGYRSIYTSECGGHLRQSRPVFQAPTGIKSGGNVLSTAQGQNERLLFQTQC